MFKTVELNKKWTDIERGILELWEDKDIFQQSLDQNAENEHFVFFEGPPTANGKPGIHHILARAYKDLVCRYKSMKGYYVPRKAGWDTHGLPVELEVEKRLKINGKHEIEEYGIEKFIEKCKESIFTYKELWEDYATKRIGYWIDMEHPYITCSNSYIESIWWGLKKIFEKNLLYKGYKSVPHCPRCQTTLSSHEVAQGYKEVQDPSIYISFPLLEDPTVSLLVWTTTPWTLTANVGAAVKKEAEYVKVKTEKGCYIVAKDRLEAVFEKEEYELLDQFLGSTLVGKKYNAPYHFYDDEMEGEGHVVIAADYVSMDDGTGIVHIAPAFGTEDMEVGKENNLPLVLSVNIDGTMKDRVTPWAGMWIKDADKKIITDLKSRGILYKSTLIKHTYPFCWRCKSPLVYMAKTSWFIEVSSLRKELQEQNEKINWLPEHIKKGRFGEWLREAKDWAISRERYWGTPLNIWECSECDHIESIGSIQELREIAKLPQDEEIELHRPYVDEISIPCPKCGKPMSRVKDVLDCWLDSGSMPYAQHHYPFEHKDDFNTLFPADFISEGIDQTRGWFYTMLTLSTILFNQNPYKNVLTFELVLDNKGEKMSKSRGNVVNVEEVIDHFGADAIRWSMYTASTPYVPRRFSKDQLKDSLKNYVIPILNVASFFVTYANIDQWKPSTLTLDSSMITSDIDRWILSKVSSLSKNVTDKLNAYEITEAARLITIFVDELTNWYIRRSRRRFWKSGSDQDKNSAYNSLFTVLLQLSKIIAPFTPFLAEYLYQIVSSDCALLEKDSVHLYSYPCEETLIDKNLESRMDVTRALVTSGLRARKLSKVKVRIPFANAYVYVPEEIQLDKDAFSLIQEEINVKEVVAIDSFDQYAEYSVKPNLPILGKKYGRKIPLIRKALAKLTTSDFKEIVSKNKNQELLLDDQTTIAISSEDILINVDGKKPYIAEETVHQAVIILNPELNQELEEEGYARELIHHIQLYRKQLDLDVQAHIHLVVQLQNKDAQKWITEHKEYISSETLADSFEISTELSSNEENVNVIEFNKEVGKISIEIQRT